MRKLVFTTLFVLLIVLAGTFAFSVDAVGAAGPGAEREAIALAIAHPALSGALAAHPGWKAAAYYTANRFEIWRVQFWDSSGGELGWADVNVTRRKVYWTEVSAGPTEAQKKAAEEALRKFVLDNKDIVDLLGDPKAYQSGIHYEPKLNLWGVFFAHPPDSVALIVEFQSGQPFVFERPVLKGIMFPDLPSYGQWQKSQESQAVALAFAQPEVSAALRGKEGWKATASPAESGNWLVSFALEGKTLAQATIDLAERKVVSFKVTAP